MHQLSSVLCLYPSAEIPGYEIFSHRSWELKQFFLEDFKSFLYSVNEIQVIAHKTIEKYDGKNISLIYCFNFFRNQL